MVDLVNTYFWFTVGELSSSFYINYIYFLFKLLLPNKTTKVYKLLLKIFSFSSEISWHTKFMTSDNEWV